MFKKISIENLMCADIVICTLVQAIFGPFVVAWFIKQPLMNAGFLAAQTFISALLGLLVSKFIEQHPTRVKFIKINFLLIAAIVDGCFFSMILIIEEYVQIAFILDVFFTSAGLNSLRLVKKYNKIHSLFGDQLQTFEGKMGMYEFGATLIGGIISLLLASVIEIDITIQTLLLLIDIGFVMAHLIQLLINKKIDEVNYLKKMTVDYEKYPIGYFVI